MPSDPVICSLHDAYDGRRRRYFRQTMERMGTSRPRRRALAPARQPILVDSANQRQQTEGAAEVGGGRRSTDAPLA